MPPRVSARITEPAPLSSVRKACRILKALASADQQRLTVLAEATGLDKATLLRLLEMLSEEGYVERDDTSKRYSMGVEARVLGVASLARFDPRPLAQPSLLRLADRFEDTILLSIPSGSESVCAAFEVGRFPIRANYLGVGGRRLLGVGAGSLALLAALPTAECEAVLPAIRAGLANHPRVTAALVEKKLEEARTLGYAITLDIVVDQMGGIGVAIPGPDGRPLAALSIAALSKRIEARRDEIVQSLKREAELCRQAWTAALAAHRQGRSR
ncbi:MAG: helix-turn-helix domain-containing protein [Burkholderiales bacterium]|nr:helix-turn-helix domain-containing protein [Burkholderiales bacterium]